jgi:hypothetical protein
MASADCLSPRARGERWSPPHAVSGTRELDRRRTIRQTTDWKSALRDARRGLAEAWDRGEETDPWVLKLRELLDHDLSPHGNRSHPGVCFGPASTDRSGRNAAS